MNDAQHWDERYSSRDRLFSGNPNGVLVTEVAGLPPGRALDVGCGEGGDTLWLAGQGWQVTAADISQVALDRGAAAAAGAGLAGLVTWQQADLTATPPPDGPFDLVSLQYFPLPTRSGRAALHRLLDVVAPGGTLLVGSHDMSDLATYRHPDFDPADYYAPDDIAQLLGDDWTVQVNESRLRTTAPPEGTHHVHDTVLHARRLR
ncbi:Methyltransferase domain-containing protein [Promicromonospora umidemergens]|uniref:Class I SAM-dependent methyltransferase n=1 Tax=Promicromonospora umidemergens TaxID=629679 RepID=A0ABP8WRV3_9MICO|nr:class I SAM-dependent methyltransferase [Promicromonospora umidemergens]MCP2283357.1 Methyltransferase domain-containing protein [Promicromonospora umidemergens]